MEKDPTYDKIEAYLDQSMPQDERRAFERAIAENPELATQVELQRFERDAMEVLVEEELRADMKTWKKEMLQDYAANNPDNIRRLKVRKIRFLAIAASFLVILAAAALIWIQPFSKDQQAVASNESQDAAREPSTITPELSEEEQPIAQLTDPKRKGTEEDEKTSPAEKLIPEEEEKTTSPIIRDQLQPQIQTAPQVATQNNTLELATQNFDDSFLLQQNTEANDALAALVKNYVDGNYEEAEKLAVQFKDPYPLGQEFLAASLFKQGDYRKAQQTYNNLMRLSLEDKGLRERTEWNLLLTYLALDQSNYVEFDRLMNRITNNKEHLFFDEADALYKRINN